MKTPLSRIYAAAVIMAGVGYIVAFFYSYLFQSVVNC